MILMRHWWCRGRWHDYRFLQKKTRANNLNIQTHTEKIQTKAGWKKKYISLILSFFMTVCQNYIKDYCRQKRKKYNTFFSLVVWCIYFFCITYIAIPFVNEKEKNNPPSRVSSEVDKNGLCALYVYGQRTEKKMNISKRSRVDGTGEFHVHRPYGTETEINSLNRNRACP